MLVIVGILLIFGLVVRQKWRNGAAKKEAILRLVAVASEEETEIAKLQVIEGYNSQQQEYNSQHKEYNSQHNNTQLEAQHYCTVCRCPTTTRCSRCKAVRYCSGKCQIIHWRQGHRDECQPALALHARKKSECDVETVPENQFSMHLKEKSKICSDPSEECDDSGSSSSSTSSFFSSTDQSEASPDTSTNEDVECQPALALHARKNSECVVETAVENLFTIHLKAETKICSATSNETSADASMNEGVVLETRIRPDKAPSVCIDSYISETISDFDDADAPSTSHPVYPFNPPLVHKIEKATATKIDESLKSANLKDKRKGGGVDVIEEFVPAEAEIGSPQLARSARTSSTEDLENQVQMSRVTRTKSAKTSANNQMPNMELSPEYFKSSKLPQSHEYRKNEIFDGKEERVVISSMSSGNCQKLHTNAGSPQVVSLETEGVQILSQSTGKGLKTSVRKLAQHFRAPKQSKPFTLDMVKDSGDNHNHKVAFEVISQTTNLRFQHSYDSVLFSIKLFMQLYSCDNVGFHPFGLVNCGNSCYANAVLQCLTFTRPLTSYLLQGLHSKTCRKRDWCFICKFEHLIQKGQESNAPLSPVGLLSHIQPIGREEDAHEFLRNVVDKMQSTCLEEAGVSGSFAEDSTLIGLTFGGYLRSKIKCMKCSGRSERYDRMLDLTVEIDGDICTLEQALAQFTKSETLGGDDKYKCNRCKSYEKAKKKLTVLEAPNVLTIVLKRFQITTKKFEIAQLGERYTEKLKSGNFEKLSKQIQFPEALNLSSYMSGRDKYPIYHLYAVVVHLAVMNGAYSGHYVSYVKNPRGHWFRIDDSRVTRVDLETVLSAEAYILFYARHTPRGASFVRDMYSDGKTKRNMEAVSSSNNSKKKNQKTKLSSSNRNTSHWMSSNDFTGVDVIDPEGWEFHRKHTNHIVDSSSDSSSIFSTSDAGSYSTDSTKDSSAEDLSGYLFGSNTNWYQP